MIKTLCFVFSGLIAFGGLLLVSMACYDGITEENDRTESDETEWDNVHTNHTHTGSPVGTPSTLRHYTAEDIALLEPVKNTSILPTPTMTPSCNSQLSDGAMLDINRNPKTLPLPRRILPQSPTRQFLTPPLQRYSRSPSSPRHTMPEDMALLDEDDVEIVMLTTV